MSRFGRTEKSIFIAALLVLMAFSYFLYDDSLLFPKTNNGQLELIGAVSISENDVRRKNLDTFAWVPASKTDNVFQNDSIFTGDRSEAVVQLQDGSQIRIQPNSLITLNLKNGQMSLDLRYGNLVGDLAKGASLTVKTGDEEFKLDSTEAPSKVQFNKAHSGVVDLKLISGDVKYSDKKKNTQRELPKNTTVAVSKKGEVKQVEAAKLTLKTQDLNLIRINPDDPIPFEWQGQGDIGRYELEISPSEDFSSTAVSKLTPESRVQVTEPLQQGAYFWRLKAYDRNGNIGITSPTHRLNIAHLAAPLITTPTQAAQMNFELKVKSEKDLLQSTELQWKAMAQLKNFTWQVSDSREFENILKEDHTAEFAARTPALPSGTYWLRVQGQTAANSPSPWSEPVSFTLNLVAYKEEIPKAPILISKNIQFTPPTEVTRTPASIEAPLLQWKPVARVKQYQIQISKDPSFAESEKYSMPETKVSWSQFRPGKNYYRVYAQGTNGLASPPSEVGTIEVTVGGVHLNPLKPIRAVAEVAQAQNANISWNQVPFAKSYLVQMDKTKNFAQPTEFEYSSSSGTLLLPAPGTYHVRVKARDENNQELTAFSNIEEVLYTFRNPLGSPKLMEPFNNASIFLQTEMEPFIWLEWKKVEGATSYQIEISDRADFSRSLITKQIAGNRYLIKDKVPLGKIFWRVRAESKSDAETSDWTEKREFTLYHQKNETFVK